MTTETKPLALSMLEILQSLDRILFEEATLEASRTDGDKAKASEIEAARLELAEAGARVLRAVDAAKILRAQEIPGFTLTPTTT